MFLSGYLRVIPISLEQGLAYGLVALGIVISLRVLSFPDLTVDGSFALGGAVVARLIVEGVAPGISILAAILAGFVAVEEQDDGVAELAEFVGVSLGEGGAEGGDDVGDPHQVERKAVEVALDNDGRGLVGADVHDPIDPLRLVDGRDHLRGPPTNAGDPGTVPRLRADDAHRRILLLEEAGRAHDGPRGAHGRRAPP
mgnify:CR=1 FL=1